MSNTPYAAVKLAVSKGQATDRIISTVVAKFSDRDPKKLKAEVYSLIYRFRKVQPQQTNEENTTLSSSTGDWAKRNGTTVPTESYIKRLLVAVKRPSTPMPQINRLD